MRDFLHGAMGGAGCVSRHEPQDMRTVAMLHVSRFTFWRTTPLLPRIQFAYAWFVFPAFALSGFAFAFFLPGLYAEIAKSAITHASAAPTEAVEYGRIAKPTITAAVSAHLATIQPCFAKPHGIEVPYRTAVVIRSGIHGPIWSSNLLNATSI